MNWRKALSSKTLPDNRLLTSTSMISLNADLQRSDRRATKPGALLPTSPNCRSYCVNSSQRRREGNRIRTAGIVRWDIWERGSFVVLLNSHGHALGDFWRSLQKRSDAGQVELAALLTNRAGERLDEAEGRGEPREESRINRTKKWSKPRSRAQPVSAKR